MLRISPTLTAIAALLVLAAGALPLRAEEARPAVKVENAWARPTFARAKTGVAYFNLTNTGKTPETLVSASAPVSAKAELHRSEMKNGVMTMRPVGPLTIKPGETVTLKPDGMHMMLIGLTHPLKAGESFPLSLTFAKSGSVSVTVPVEKSPAASAGMTGMPGMGGSGAMPMKPMQKP